MFLHGLFSQSARKGYFNNVPSLVRLEFNGERIWSGVYVLTDSFDLQRHLLKIDFRNYVSRQISDSKLA